MITDHPDVVERSSGKYQNWELVEHDNPYAIGLTGLIGLIGFGGCPKALDDADLLLVGTDFPHRQFIPTGKTIVQIDSRPEHLGRRARLDYGIAGDAALTQWR
jgi:pyruvate dehydrogenase (quinone)